MNKNLIKITLLIALTLFSYISVYAGMGGGPMGGNMGMGMGMGGGPNIPINNGLIFLLVAGLLFGAKKIYDISKQKEIIEKD
jgi:hypothetical protein